jgi:diadenosine tetraphosphate (Ap4A) HIT family hydrolase
MTVEACPICQKHEGRGPLAGEQVYADEHVVAFHAPVDRVGGYLGYLFVETRRHVRGLADRSDAEACAEARLVTRLARALEDAGAENVYTFVFDHLPHHHVHVVARYPGTPEEFRGTRIDEWPDAPRGEAEDVAAFCARLRTALA